MAKIGAIQSVKFRVERRALSIGGERIQRIASIPGRRSDQTVTEETRIVLFFADVPARERHDTIHVERNWLCDRAYLFNLYSDNLRQPTKPRKRGIFLTDSA